MSLDLLEQLRSLENELAGLEDLLARDENYKALQQLNTRESQGNRVRAIDDQRLRANLEASLSSSRIYQARGRLLEVIALLKAEMPAAPTGQPEVDAKPEVAAGPDLTEERSAAPKPEPEENVEPQAEDSLLPVAASTAAVAGVAAALVPWQETGAGDDDNTASVETKPTAEPEHAPVALEDEAEPQRLELIKGIDLSLSKRLSEAGIMSYAQIAAWKKGDIARMNSAFDLNGAIGRDGWIEQAAALSSGTQTAYARGYDRDESEFIVAAPAPEGQAVDPTLSAKLKSMSAAIVSLPLATSDDDAAVVAEPEVTAPSVAVETSQSLAAEAPRPPAPLLGERVFVPKRPGSLENLPVSEGDGVLPPPLPISEALFEGLPGSDAGIVRSEPAQPMQFRLPEDEDNGDAGKDGQAPGPQNFDLDDEAEVSIVSRPADADAVPSRSMRSSAGSATREPAINRFKAPVIGAAAVSGPVAASTVEAQVEIVRNDVSTNESELPTEISEPVEVKTATGEAREEAETVLPGEAVPAVSAVVLEEPAEPLHEPEPVQNEPERVEQEAEPVDPPPRPAFVKRPSVQEEVRSEEPLGSKDFEPGAVPQDSLNIDVEEAEVAIQPLAAAPEPADVSVAAVAVEESGGERKSKRLLRALTGE